MIELAEFIDELRRELQRATAAGAVEPLQFELGTVELQASVTAIREGAGDSRVRLGVIELGEDPPASEASTQRLRIVLQPRLDSGSPVNVAGPPGPDFDDKYPR